MPTARIPFVNRQESGQEALAGAMPVAKNVLADSKGAVRRRPGLVAHPAASLGAAVTGLFETSGGTIYAVDDGIPTRNIHRVTATGTAPVAGTEKDLLGRARPTFAETESILVLAGGSHPQKVLLDGHVSSRLAGDPPEATHAASNASRVLLNDIVELTGGVHYSSPAGGSAYSGFEEWNTDGDSGSFTAEARPDRVVAIADTSGEVWVWGSRTLQVWLPDGNDVYAPGPTLEIGCSAPYSIVRVASGFVWLDDRRRIVMSDGRSDEVLSEPIQADLHDLATAADCFGYRYTSGPWDAFLWTFPTARRTYCFQKGNGWGLWEGWGRTHFPVTAKTDVAATAETLVGLEDGTLAYLDRDTSTDLGDPILAYLETGYEARGTDAPKHCACVRLTLRRGHAASGDNEPVGLLSWRDDEGQWGSPVEVGFGAPNETESVVALRGLGTYRRRQWRFTFSGTEDMVLVAATEEFRVAGQKE